MRGHAGTAGWTDTGEDAGVDPRITASLVGLAVLGLIAIFAGPGLGLALLAVAGGALLLARGRHEIAARDDGIRPWPHVAPLPAALAGTELLDADGPGRERCGIIWHRPTGLMSGTVLLEPSALLPSDPAVAETYAACWWSLLEDACARPEIRAAAVTVDVRPGGRPQPPVRLTLTVDPAATWQSVSSVARAAAITVWSLHEIDAAAAGLAVLRVATPADLARMAKSALDPRYSGTGAEPPAWGEHLPQAEADLSRVYRHARCCSVSWALHVPPGQRPGAEAVPQLLRPGRYPRRVTLVRREDRREVACSVFVTVSVPEPDPIGAACAEVEALVRTTQPRLQICRDVQAAAFRVGLPVGWFPPYPVDLRYEALR